MVFGSNLMAWLNNLLIKVLLPVLSEVPGSTYLQAVHVALLPVNVISLQLYYALQWLDPTISCCLQDVDFSRIVTYRSNFKREGSYTSYGNCEL